MAGQYYSVQNSDGFVYGIFDMPDGVDRTPAEVVEELQVGLGDILGINGVRSSVLTLEGQTEPVDRVVIDLEPSFAEEQARLDRVHETIGRLAAPAPVSDK